MCPKGSEWLCSPRGVVNQLKTLPTHRAITSLLHCVRHSEEVGAAGVGAFLAFWKAPVRAVCNRKFRWCRDSIGSQKDDGNSRSPGPAAG